MKTFTLRKLTAFAAGALLSIACASGTNSTADDSDTDGLGTPAPWTAPAEPPPPPPPPARDPSTIPDGTWAVPSDMAPGQWRTVVPADGHCYWERLKDADGTLGSIIANENLDGGAQGIVTIKATDKFFKASGGCVWRKVA